MMSENHAWKTLLPDDGGLGMCPQIGRVWIPAVYTRPTLNLAGGRRIKGLRACWPEGKSTRFVTLIPSTGRLRKEMDSLTGGETVEFIGHPSEWHDMSGQTSYIVVVTDMAVSATKRSNEAAS